MLNHPVTCLGYRVSYGERVFVYLGDNEPYYNVYNDNDPEVNEFTRDMNNRVLSLSAGAYAGMRCAVYHREYAGKKGWGHSTTHHVVNLALKAGVEHLVFFHHDPQRTDDELDFIVNHYRERVRIKGIDIEIDAAGEGRRFRI